MFSRIYGFMIIMVVTWIGIPCAAEESPETKLDFTGYMFIQAGQVVKGHHFGSITLPHPEHQWMEEADIGLFAEERIDDHLSVRMGIEAVMGFSFNVWPQKDDKYNDTKVSKTVFTIAQGEGIYTFGDTSSTAFEIEAGYFPYKYNHDIRNLGEYLFRTTCYPTVMRNLPDRTYTELLGFRAGHLVNTSFGTFHHDLILNSETKEYPLYDFTLAYLGDYSLGRILTLGGGVSLYRILPVDSRITTPEPNTNNPNLYYITAEGDTGLFSYGGTKLMARASVDLKGFMPISWSFFGKHDLKVYSEAALLGVKDYPVTFDSIRTYPEKKERLPVMAGFNWPTHPLVSYTLMPGIAAFFMNNDSLSKLSVATIGAGSAGILAGLGAWYLEKRFARALRLDVLNLEAEYLDSPNVNSFYSPFYRMLPLPDKEFSYQKHARWKWSVYANKTIGTKLVLSGQIARDHFIPSSSTLYGQLNDYTDITFSPGDWWWMFRVRFNF